MLPLTEGEKDSRPFVQGDFELPGYERKDIVVASKQYCVFFGTTEHKVGSREIQKQVFVVREIGGREVEVEAGIDAGGLWWIGKRLIKVYEGIDGRLLPWVRENVEELEKGGCFDKWIGDMQKEYESGQNFVSELIPAVLDRFPEYNLVIDRYEKYKTIDFVEEPLRQRSIHLRIAPHKFDFSVGEIMEVGLDQTVDYLAFSLDGKRFQPHDFVAVWYPTKDRDTAYDIDDTGRRTKLLQQSFDTLENFLEQYYK